MWNLAPNLSSELPICHMTCKSRSPGLGPALYIDIPFACCPCHGGTICNIPVDRYTHILSYRASYKPCCIITHGTYIDQSPWEWHTSSDSSVRYKILFTRLFYMKYYSVKRTTCKQALPILWIDHSFAKRALFCYRLVEASGTLNLRKSQKHVHSMENIVIHE